MIISESKLDVMIEQLVATVPTKQRLAAHAFLYELARQSDDDAATVSLPVARRIMEYPGWQDILSIHGVRTYCEPRVWVAKMLRYAPMLDGIDPEAEYMVGMAIGLLTDLLRAYDE